MVDQDYRWNEVITATLRSFINNDKSGKWELDECRADGKPRFLLFEPLFYANGNCKDNKGYVSVIFHEVFAPLSFILSAIQISCTVSVVDVAGHKRFMQSFAYSQHVKTVIDLKNRIEFGLDRYLKRKTLMNDPDKLLPGNCLTICMELDYAFHENIDSSNLLSKDASWHLEGAKFYLNLDTAFGRELCRLSEVFQRASDIPMIESRTRKMHIPDEELYDFGIIYNIIFKGTEEWWMQSILDICRVYDLANKYIIQSVIEVCRQIIKGLLSTRDDPKVVEHAAESVNEIFELADMHRDSDLKDIVETYLESPKNFGTDDYAPTRQLNEKLCTEWKCEFRDIGNSEPAFWVTRITEPEFDFYQ